MLAPVLPGAMAAVQAHNRGDSSRPAEAIGPVVIGGIRRHGDQGPRGGRPQAWEKLCQALSRTGHGTKL